MIQTELVKTSLFYTTFSIEISEYNMAQPAFWTIRKIFTTMEEEQNNSIGETSNRSLPNNTTTRSVERTTTQKLPIPILEKNDHTRRGNKRRLHLGD